jgi:hypothetical protein
VLGRDHTVLAPGELPNLANLAQKAYRRARRPALQAHGRETRLEWLESLRSDLATRCLDRSESPLWDVVDRAAFASAMLDVETLPKRRQAAETLFGIVTLFEYEQLRARRRRDDRRSP